jgi:deazaflavin-dependent oxidoreductase (nitroreductase family)
VRFLLRRGLGGPNVLLTVRGRRSGQPRTTPVAMLEHDGRRFVEAAFGEVDWVRNLRASGQAVLRGGRWSQAVRAVELPPEAGGRLVHDLLADFPRRRRLRSVLGPTVRPPAAMLFRYRFRVDDRLEDYISHARRCPVFEMIPMGDGDRGGVSRVGPSSSAGHGTVRRMTQLNWPLGRRYSKPVRSKSVRVPL